MQCSRKARTTSRCSAVSSSAERCSSLTNSQVIMRRGKSSEGKSRKDVVAADKASTEREIQDTYSLEFDGASKGNPGRAGAGAILKRPDGTVLCQLTRGVGTATCNFAEYQALIMGLQAALDRGIRHIRAQGDSKLVCSQVTGSWKVNSPNLSASFLEAMKLKGRFKSFSIQHVYREFNAAADILANTAVTLPDNEPLTQCSSSLDLDKAVKKHKAMKGLASAQRSCSLQDVLPKPTKEKNENFHLLAYSGAWNGKSASAGAVLYSPDGTLKLEIKRRIDQATRNVAQYEALVIGLRAALECNISHMEIQSDALLVYKQMTGVLMVKDERLQVLYREAFDLLTGFSDFTFTHVEKSRNSEARSLAEAALHSPDICPQNDKPESVGASSESGMLNVVGYTEPKVQNGFEGDTASNMKKKPVESSIKRLCIAAHGLQYQGYGQSMLYYCNHSNGKANEIVPRPLPLSRALSKGISIYARDMSIHKIVLRCTSSRVRVIPHIFQRSLMHIQAMCPYK